MMPNPITGALKAVRNSLLLLLALSVGSSAAWLGVTAQKANVRSHPRGNSTVLWQVFIYTPFTSLGKRGNWIRISNLMGATGWVHASVLQEMSAVIVRTKKANIRSSPGMSGEIIWKVDYGYPFKVIDSQGNWLQVEDDENIQGWIHKDVVWGDKEMKAKDGPSA